MILFNQHNFHNARYTHASDARVEVAELSYLPPKFPVHPSFSPFRLIPAFQVNPPLDIICNNICAANSSSSALSNDACSSFER